MCKNHSTICILEFIPTCKSLRISMILHVSNLRLQVSHPSSIIEPNHGEHSQEDQGDEYARNHASIRWFSRIRLSSYRRYQISTVLSAKAIATYTAICWMTDVIVVLAFTRGHAMVSVVAFRADWRKKWLIQFLLKWQSGTYFQCTVLQSSLVYNDNCRRSFGTHPHYCICNAGCSLLRNVLMHMGYCSFCPPILANTDILLKIWEIW